MLFRSVFLDENNLPLGEYDLLDVYLNLDATQAKQRDLISFTITVAEIENGFETDKRGVTTIIHVI